MHHTRTAAMSIASLMLASMMACTDTKRDVATTDTARDSSGTRISVALVDSVPWRNDLTDGTLRRVAITSRAGTDTVRDVLTTQLPVVVGDSIVGLRWEEDRLLGAFEYAPATRNLRKVALPTDAFEGGTPSFAPDGRHLAYVALDSTGKASGVVLAWPSAGIVFRGAPVTMLAGDAGIEGLSWQDATHFTLELALERPHGSYQRVRGTIGADGRAAVVVDTVNPPLRP